MRDDFTTISALKGGTIIRNERKKNGEKAEEEDV